MSRRGAFLDRDGTLNVRPPEHRYITSTRDFVWLPGAREAIARLHRAGYVVAVVSNQRGVARGLVSTAVVREIDDRIQNELARYGCRVETFRYCFHDYDEQCDCRKPRPGMLLSVARDLDIDLSQSWMIGDDESDVRAGKAAGCRTALVGSSASRVEADLVAPSLDAISRAIAGRALVSPGG